MENRVRSFRDLIVWQKAHNFVLEIYNISKPFPKEEMYGVTSQLRRAAISIPANIVEGHKRKTRKDFLHFLNISEASLEEAKYLVLLTRELGYLGETDYYRVSLLADEVGRVLYGFQKSIGKHDAERLPLNALR